MTNEEAKEILIACRVMLKASISSNQLNENIEAFDVAIRALDNEIWMEKLHKTTCAECIQRAQDYFDLAKED